MLVLALVATVSWSAPAAAAAAAAAPSPAPAVLILDGESTVYHDWRSTTPLLRKVLEETGLFRVEVISTPPPGEALEGFQPDFSSYAAVLLNYDAPDGRWPAALQDAFEEYIRSGGGLVIVHAANNAFPGWQAFNEMIGIGGWRGRGAQAGPYWYLDGEGTLTADPAPGPAGTHGRRLPYQIITRAEHPVTAGLPARWMHAGDELYAHLRGPGQNMTVLASAWSDPANSGSGRHEPQLIAVSWGRGRVFHTTLGHDVAAMASVGFVVTLQRGTEWAATGSVTQAVPADFPSDSAPVVRPDLLGAGAQGQP